MNTTNSMSYWIDENGIFTDRTKERIGSGPYLSIFCDQKHARMNLGILVKHEFSYYMIVDDGPRADWDYMFTEDAGIPQMTDFASFVDFSEPGIFDTNSWRSDPAGFVHRLQQTNQRAGEKINRLINDEINRGSSNAEARKLALSRHAGMADRRIRIKCDQCSLTVVARADKARVVLDRLASASVTELSLTGLGSALGRIPDDVNL